MTTLTESLDALIRKSEEYRDVEWATPAVVIALAQVAKAAQDYDAAKVGTERESRAIFALHHALRALAAALGSEP